jgi:hypothetical protein
MLMLIASMLIAKITNSYKTSRGKNDKCINTIKKRKEENMHEDICIWSPKTDVLNSTF